MKKGTKVTIHTTNGGIVTGVLWHDYTPSYPLTVERADGSYLILMGYRVKSVEVLS